MDDKHAGLYGPGERPQKPMGKTGTSYVDSLVPRFVWVLESSENHGPSAVEGVFSRPELALSALDARPEVADFTELTPRRVDDLGGYTLSFELGRGEREWVVPHIHDGMLAGIENEIDRKAVEYMLARCSNWPPK